MFKFAAGKTIIIATLFLIDEQQVQSTKPWVYSFSNCKSLTLVINLKKWELPALAIMLQSCPELESLTIDMTTPQSRKVSALFIAIDGYSFFSYI